MVCSFVHLYVASLCCHALHRCAALVVLHRCAAPSCPVGVRQLLWQLLLLLLLLLLLPQLLPAPCLNLCFPFPLKVTKKTPLPFPFSHLPLRLLSPV